jgi:EAL domain-containing protein (putative c-di-GMP-specific phosphodiesterase class I)
MPRGQERRAAGNRAMTHDPEFYVDEAGIAYGRFGSIVLKSSYQPLYAREAGLLVPFGVEALVTGFRNEQAVAPAELFGLVDGLAQATLERLCRMLHIRNYENMGLPGMELYFNADPYLTTADIEHLEWLLEENALAAELVTCEITEGAAEDDRLIALAAELRGAGLRLAVDDFGAGHSTAARVRTLRPDTVKIDGGWFHAVAAREAARAQLPALFERLRGLGCRILVEGIETRHQLTVAVEAGADLFQGFLLGRPALAGTVVDLTPLEIDMLAQDRVERRSVSRG